MAKQPRDDSRKNPRKPDDEIELIGEEDVEEVQPATPKPPPIPHKKTQLGKRSTNPTMLAPGEPKGPDTPPKMPKLSMEEDEVIEAEAADSGVVEAEPVDSGVVEAQPASDALEVAASDVVEAEPAASDVVMASPASDVMEVTGSDVVEAAPLDSGVVEAAPADDEDIFSDSADVAPEEPGKAPETPVRAEHAAERPPSVVFDDEDAIGGEILATHAESSVRVKGKKKPAPDLEVTDAFDLEDARKDDIEQTVSFEHMPGSDESSAVDLGGKPYPKKGSHSGIDEVAEELESGVKLESASSPSPKKQRRPEPSVEFDDLLVDNAPKSGARSPKAKHEDKTDPDLEVSGEAEEAEAVAAEAFEEETVAEEAPAEEVAADELLSEAESEKTVAEDEAADLWKEAGDAVEAKTAAPSTPVPTKKKKSRIADEDETVDMAPPADEEEAEAAPPPPKKRKPGGGTAVMSRPPRPKYGRRWFGGMLLGIIIAAGALVGLRYFDPNLLEQGFGYLPDAPKPKQPVAEKKDDAALITAKADLEKAEKEKTELLEAQKTATTQTKALQSEVAGLKENEKAVLQLRDLLAKSKVIDDKADVKELPKAISQALADKEEKEKLVEGFEKALADAKLTDKEKLDVAAFTKLVKDLADKQAGLAAVNKTLEDAKVKEAGKKGVEELLAARKDLDGKLAAVNKALADEKVKDEGAKGLQEIVTMRNKLQKDRDDLEQSIKTAYKELSDAQLAPPGGDPRRDLVAGAKTARQRAESPLVVPLTELARVLGNLGGNPAMNVKNTFENAALLAELNYYRLREPLIQSPEQKLDTHLAILQDRKHQDAKEQAAAVKDAEWVLAPDAKASPAAKAKAQAVIGLVLRNQQKYTEAKQALEAAAAVANAGPVGAVAKQALEELTDPSAFYLPRVDQYQTNGNVKSAVDELSTALKVMPNDPRLVVQRGLLRLDEVRGTGKVSAETEAAIRKDAAVALKSPKAAAEGAYVLGLLEEELGDFTKAEDHFRQALKSSQGSGEEASRYRVALARVLLRDRAPAIAVPPAPPMKEPAPPLKEPAPPKKEPAPVKEKKEEKKIDNKEEKTTDVKKEENKENKKEEKKEEKKADDDKGAVSQAFPLAAALVVGQVYGGQPYGGQDDEDDPAASARLKESIELAKELIESKNQKIRAQGHMLLGQALAKQGKRTEGVREYMKGMQLLHPDMASKEMSKLIEEHPAFQQADPVAAPSAYLAEVHFGKGLHAYWSRQYPEAEGHFKQAAGFFPLDARYQYFLGLSQIAQKSKVKRDAAYFSFEKGAKLEAANRPPVSEINASLERVQGDLRKLINEFRSKAIELKIQPTYRGPV